MDSQGKSTAREPFTWRQIGFTVLPGLICVFALTGAVHSAAVLTHNTNRLYKLSKIEEWPAPCGMALPSLSRLAIELGGFPIVGNPIPTSKDLFVKAKDALCSSSGPEEFAVHFYRHAEYTEVTNGSEYQVKDAICNAGYHRRVDLLTRVSRAYLNAGPAFYAYNENTTNGLCGFRYSCDKWDTILAHMGQAKTLDVTYGVVGSMPHVNTMLYRLVALSVLGQDQPSCFQPKTVNTTMCEEVYKDTTPPEGTKSPWQKDRVCTTHTTTTATSRQDGAAQRQTSRPLTRRLLLQTATTTTQLFSTVKECTSTLFSTEWGCLESQTCTFIQTLRATTSTSALCPSCTAQWLAGGSMITERA